MRDWDTWEFAAVEVLDDVPSCVYPCRCGRCGAEWDNVGDDVGCCPVCACAQVFMSAPAPVPQRLKAQQCGACRRVYTVACVGPREFHAWDKCLCGEEL